MLFEVPNNHTMVSRVLLEYLNGVNFLRQFTKIFADLANMMQ